MGGGGDHIYIHIYIYVYIFIVIYIYIYIPSPGATGGQPEAEIPCQGGSFSFSEKQQRDQQSSHVIIAALIWGEILSATRPCERAA